MKIRALVLFLLLLFASPSLAITSPTEDLMKIGVGARPMGMGKAFVAVADDGNAVFLNPAGLASLKTWQITSMYTSLFEGELPYILLTGSYPFEFGNLGLGFISTGTGQIISPSPGGITYFDYYDRLFFISYAEDAQKRFGWKNILLGGNLKIFTKGFSGPVANSGFGLDCDLGVKYTYNPWLTFGANLQNALPLPLRWSSGSEDDIPMLFKVGTATRVYEEKILLALDMDLALGRPLPTPFHFGVEWPVNQYLTLRTGLDQIVSAASKISTNFTAGVGLDYSGFRMDYAYHPYQETSASVAHYISFSYSPTLEVQPVVKPK